MTVAKRLHFNAPGFGRFLSTNGNIEFAGDVATKEKCDQGSAGDGEEWMPGKLSFDTKNTPDISPVTIRKLRNITITVQDDAGKTWLCRGCSTTNQTPLSGGEIKVEMEFDDQEEVI